MGDENVLIVGASLAGLACARRLVQCGVAFQILEASNTIGGRWHTDPCEGYLLDRAFPLLLTGWPELQRVCDVHDLALSPYQQILVQFAGGFRRLPWPSYRLSSVISSLRSPVVSLRDQFRWYQLAQRLRQSQLEHESHRPDVMTLDWLRWVGRFSPNMIERVFRPLIGLLTMEVELTAPSRYFRYVFRALLCGELGVPAQGLQAIAQQIARSLPKETIRLDARVARISREGCELTSGDYIQGRAVVLAMGETAERELLEQRSNIRPFLEEEASQSSSRVDRTHATIYYEIPETPSWRSSLILNGDGKGLVNAVAISPSQPVLAVQILDLPAVDDPTSDRLVREQLLSWFGASVHRWRLLRIYRYRGISRSERTRSCESRSWPVRIWPGVYRCSGHSQGGELDSALISGFEAAQAVMEDLSMDLT